MMNAVGTEWVTPGVNEDGAVTENLDMIQTKMTIPDTTLSCVPSHMRNRAHFKIFHV